MKIRTRVITAIITITLCISAVLFAVSGTVMSRNYSNIENNLMRGNLHRIQYAIDNEEITLNKQAKAQACSDDTYRFAVDGNPEYIRHNFSGKTFTDAEASVFAIVSPSGQLIFAGSYDLEKKIPTSLSPETQKAFLDPYLLCQDQGKGKIGIMSTREGPLLIGTTPILNGRGEGPIHGTLIMGRYLDKSFVRILNIVTELVITIQPLPDPGASGKIPRLSPQEPVYIQPLDAYTLSGYYLIPDVYGRPYLVANTHMERDVYAQGKTALLWFFCIVSAVAVILILVNIRILDTLVLSRLRKLSRFAKNISQKGDFSSRVSLGGKDELTELGQEVNAMLGKLAAINEQLGESESKYSTLVENSGDGILLVVNGRAAYCNPRIVQISGYTREEIPGSVFLRYIHPEFRDAVSSHHRDMLNGKPVPERYEIEINHKSGESIPVEICVREIYLNHQRGYMVVLRDIMERKKAEKAREDLLKEEQTHRQNLEEEARLRTQFINVLAHELRTPLTPIMLSLETLQESLGPSASGVQQKIIKNALDGTETLRNRLEELLDLVRSSSGSFTLKPAFLDTGEFLETAASRYRPALDKKQQQLKLDLAAGLPGIEADPSRLEQVIVNLFSNASKYSPEKSLITLQASEIAQGILIEVKDQGIGIPHEELDKLFTPYHRVERDRRQYPGIGLGLAVCKQIIEAHHGRIWVESVHGQGSTFKFIVPLVYREDRPVNAAPVKANK